jgi:hypothetical protein
VPADLVDRLAERLEPDEVKRRARRRFVMSRRPIRDGQLAQVRRLEELGVDDELARRGTVIAELERQGERPRLLFEGKEVVFPAVAREPVEWIFDRQGSFTASELPGSLDRPGRLVLVRRLVREGFLVAR